MQSQLLRRLPRLIRQYHDSFEKITSSHGSTADPLLNRNCLITGGSSGIGLAIAKRFIDDGAAAVTIVGRDEQKLSVAREELERRKNKTQAVGHFVGDVSENAMWYNGTGRAVMDGVDTLVNAAGMSQNRLLTFTRDEEIEQVLNTNLGGTIYTTRAFIKSFMKNKARDRSRGDDPDYSSKLGTDVGSIINISSLLGVKRGAGATAYAASKAGILGFTRALAHEMSMRDNRTLAIRVNAIVPGYIDTPMLDDLANRQRLAESIPLGRLGTPDEVADAAVFLACNSYAHNCILNLDGGLSAT